MSLLLHSISKSSTILCFRRFLGAVKKKLVMSKAGRLTPKCGPNRKPKIDLQLSNMQQEVRKVAFVTLQTTNFLLQNGSGSTNAISITQSVDAIALLGYVNNQLAEFRREQIKPSLKQEYSTISSAEVPLKSEYLSGDNLVKQLRHTKESIAKVSTVGHALPTSTPLYGEQTFRPPGALK